MLITLRNGLKMSEYEVYWLIDFPLIIYWVRTKNNYGVFFKIANKQVQGKISNFTVIRDHSIKSKETRVVTYTCSGDLIPNSSLHD